MKQLLSKCSQRVRPYEESNNADKYSDETQYNIYKDSSIFDVLAL